MVEAPILHAHVVAAAGPTKSGQALVVAHLIRRVVTRVAVRAVELLKDLGDALRRANLSVQALVRVVSVVVVSERNARATA